MGARFSAQLGGWTLYWAPSLYSSWIPGMSKMRTYSSDDSFLPICMREWNVTLGFVCLSSINCWPSFRIPFPYFVHSPSVLLPLIWVRLLPGGEGISPYIWQVSLRSIGVSLFHLFGWDFRHLSALVRRCLFCLFVLFRCH